MPDELRLLAFGFGGEWYALDAAHVRSIEPETQITPVPRAPEWLLGVFNLRGAILPALDCHPLLGAPRSDAGRKGLLVVFQWEGNAAALRVDAVEEMYEVPASSVEPLFSSPNGVRASVMLGQVRVRDHLIGVINLGALMTALVEG